LGDRFLGGVRQRHHAISSFLELGQGFDDVGVRGRDQDQLQEPAPLVVGDLLSQELCRHSHRRVADLPEIVVAASDVIDQRILQHEGEPSLEGGLVVKRLVDLARHAAQIQHRFIDVEDQDLRPFDRFLHAFSPCVAGSWQRHTNRQKQCEPAKWEQPRIGLQGHVHQEEGMATQPSSTFDTVNRKTAPHGTPGDAQSCPPCAVMIDRQIDSPMPMPWGLVVKKGSKMQMCIDGGDMTATLKLERFSRSMTSSSLPVGEARDEQDWKVGVPV